MLQKRGQGVSFFLIVNKEQVKFQLCTFATLVTGVHFVDVLYYYDEENASPSLQNMTTKSVVPSHTIRQILCVLMCFRYDIVDVVIS